MIPAFSDNLKAYWSRRDALHADSLTLAKETGTTSRRFSSLTRMISQQSRSFLKLANAIYAAGNVVRSQRLRSVPLRMPRTYCEKSAQLRKLHIQWEEVGNGGRPTLT